MAYDQQRLPQLLASLYRVIGELESMFPGLLFTPDGSMVRSLGVALAAVHYGITLEPGSTPPDEGLAGRRKVQIKVAQDGAIELGGEPQHLIAVAVKRDGTLEEWFNGPGSVVWGAVSSKPPPRNGQYKIRASALRNLMKKVGPDQRIPLAVRSQSSPRW